MKNSVESRGRDFNSSDRAGSPAVAIVSKSLARRYFTAEDALGKRLLLRRLGSAERFTIIGVAQDLRQTLPKGTPERTVYTLSTQLPESEQGSASSRIIGLIIRTRVDPSSIAPTIRRVVAGIDKDQAVADMVPMEVAIDRRMAGLRDNAMLVALFAALAVTLAVVGVFSVVSYSVLSRRREFGIRTALGAQRASILALIIFETMPYGIVGVAVGMASVLGASRFLSSLFYNVDISTGPLILTVSGFLITVVMMSIVVAARGTMVMKVGEALRQP
jgi:putative ABC transport system permease protein